MYCHSVAKSWFVKFVEVNIKVIKCKTATDLQTTVPAKYRILDVTVGGVHGGLGALNL